MTSDEENPNNHQIEQLRQAILQHVAKVEREERLRRIKAGIASKKVYERAKRKYIGLE
jgi:hypothetical protein